MSRRLCILFETKPEINQPGRLINHLMGELGIDNPSRQRASDSIAESLEALSRSGIVRLDKSGKIYNSVTYLKNQADRRAESLETAKPAPQVEAPSQDETTTEEEAITMAEHEDKPMDIKVILGELSEKVLVQGQKNETLGQENASLKAENEQLFEQVERAHVQVTSAARELESVSALYEETKENLKESERQRDDAIRRATEAEEELLDAQVKLERAASDSEADLTNLASRISQALKTPVG